MSYTSNPATNPIDEVRLYVGDIHADIEMLDDATYQFYLDKYNSNAKRASVEAAKAILFKLAHYTRERAGDIEVYGGEWFKNYRSALKDYVNDPKLSVFVPMPYAGGISKTDMRANDIASDNMRSGIYAGMTEGIPNYDRPLSEE